jgi:glycosyltransferase involved in cell wall biosynthesis
MKIVHIIIGLNIGGAELMLKRVIESHSEYSDIQHTVISLTNHGPVGRQLVDSGFSVYSLGISSFLNIPSRFIKLRKLLIQLQPDIVQTWMYHADLLGSLAAWSSGFSRILWNVRSTDILKGGSKATIVIRKICAWLSGFLPLAIVCAANASRIEHEAVGYTSGKMLVIPNGFELNKSATSGNTHTSIRDEFGIDKTCKVILSVGRYSEVKDHKNFIKAAGLISMLLEDVKFLLVGRDLTEDNKEIVSMIKFSGITDSVFLLGEREDISKCMRESDVFCMHSKTEGFPNVLGEAMATGLPCVATDVGDAAYLLGNPEWVVPPSSPEVMAEKLYQLLSLSTHERKDLGLSLTLRIKKKFTMKQTSQRYLDLYKSVLSSNSTIPVNKN